MISPNDLKYDSAVKATVKSRNHHRQINNHINRENTQY